MPQIDATRILSLLPQEDIYSAKVLDGEQTPMLAGFATLKASGEHEFDPKNLDPRFDAAPKYIVIGRYPPVAILTFRRTGGSYAFTL